MNPRRIPPSLILLVLFLSGCVGTPVDEERSQNNLHGTVRDAGGDPVAQVAVDVLGGEFARTDSAGSYSVMVLPGSWTVEFSKPDYVTVDTSITMTRGNDKRLDVVLRLDVGL
jgi:hypothetical protein